jgi:hypothetical protein
LTVMLEIYASGITEGHIRQSIYHRVHSIADAKVQTILPTRVDCGWQSPGEAANHRSERLTSLASNPIRTARAAPPQTSGIRDFPCPFAMMISSQLAPDV